MLCIGSAIVVEKSDPSCWHTADSAALTGSLGNLRDPKVWNPVMQLSVGSSIYLTIGESGLPALLAAGGARQVYTDTKGQTRRRGRDSPLTEQRWLNTDGEESTCAHGQLAARTSYIPIRLRG